MPIELEPVQKPHPPLWYGVEQPRRGAVGRQNAVNVVCNVPAGAGAAIAERYRAEWAAAGKPAEAMPLVGMNRHIVIADSDAEAIAIARRAYRHWYDNFFCLFRKHNTRPPFALYPETFEEFEQMGFGVAGSPGKVRDALVAQAAEARINYLVCRLAFGDLSLAESMRSTELYARAVMPALAGRREAAE